MYAPGLSIPCHRLKRENTIHLWRCEFNCRQGGKHPPRPGKKDPSNLTQTVPWRGTPFWHTLIQNWMTVLGSDPSPDVSDQTFPDPEYDYLLCAASLCCGSGSAWIRITVKGRFRICFMIRINVISWIQIRITVISWIRTRIRINLKMTSQNVWKMSYFSTFSRF
jgi:hypothetical protein